ncbi:MAG: hypothetical protein HY895_22990 [Deltaproteobacteria bacterium]|nr:hypothetical protein [Deltaproteobacteria bacterium]
MFFLKTLLFVAMAAALAPVGAGNGADEVQLPGDATPGLLHLASLVGPENQNSFHPEQIAGLLRFIDAPKRKDAMYSAKPMDGASSSYFDVDVRMPLDDLLKYTFNPRIHGSASVPASLRMAAWEKYEKPWQSFPRVWELFDPNGTPVLIRGMETVENTPDLSTGGYYRYTLFRTVILFRSGERRVVISLAKQAGPSEVGKKGYILGEDEDWDYFYSGEPGLDVTGLGWVKSYMLESFGISIYFESAPAAPGVRVANLKWLRAGWSGLNVVRSEHIYSGLKRFALTTQQILESPRLPAVATLEDVCQRISNLTEAQIREKMQAYRNVLLARTERLNGSARKSLPESFWNDDWWARMTREEMESVLVLETLKVYLGRTPEAEVRSLVSLPAVQLPQPGG